ncbi:FecR domain-containing protein [Aquibium sp. LZ166]|uniref:FecR domain-containing protein n=1 Tax=Aquibium pacificus TaxID=3153579 RepID=A0ABV3SDT5_9HYPH
MRTVGIFCLATVAAFAAGPAFAQSGCSIEQLGGTQRHVVRCGTGITITVEPGAQYTLRDRNGDGTVDRVSLSSKALLLEASGNAATSGFEVVAPQAIAAVRGTRWAVDAEGAETSVFVVEGQVAVARHNGTARVVLDAGEGVDVDAGTGPLTVKTWPARRVNALLARFGL